MMHSFLFNTDRGKRQPGAAFGGNRPPQRPTARVRPTQE